MTQHTHKQWLHGRMSEQQGIELDILFHDKSGKDKSNPPDSMMNI
jgi:hypothetical protein